VRHECEQAVDFCPSVIACTCARDEGRPLGADLQELASNHLKLLWSEAMVAGVLMLLFIGFNRLSFFG